MNKIRKFTAAAAAFAIAASVTGCAAPEAITFGKSTQTAVTIDGYEVPAGIFVYNELYAYNSAAYNLYMQNGSYPSLDIVKEASIEGTDSTEWIQNEATDYCKDFVVTEKEFDKIGVSLTEEEIQLINDSLKNSLENELFETNGVGSESLKSIITNSYKQQHIFEYYYGLDSEFGCTEDELKEYYIDKTARINYFTISMTDSNGEALDDDTKHELENKIKNYLLDINKETDNLAKMQKLNECRDDYKEFVEKMEAEAAAEEETGEAEEITTTDVTADNETTATTTTTTAPYEKEITVTKYTTAAADENAEGSETTTTAAEETDAEKAAHKYNDYLFNELENYKAVRYDYDENTVYIVIKGDITERMTEDDLWNEDSVDALLQERYYKDFSDKMKSISENFVVERNNSAYRKYTPFKLQLEAKNN